MNIFKAILNLLKYGSIVYRPEIKQLYLKDHPEKTPDEEFKKKQ